ncbi:MAG: LolA family protein [Myxococcales bacterium]
MIRWLAFLLAATFPVGCHALENAMLAHVLRHQARLQSYRGVLVEQGLIPEGELRSEVAFARPDRVAVRVTAPDLYKGTALVYRGGSLTLYWPQVSYAVKVDGLPVPDADGERQLVADSYQHGLDAYDVDLGWVGHTAGHPTVALKYAAKRKGSPLCRFTLDAYDKYSVFIAGDMHFAGGADYAFRYESIDFNQPLGEAVFELQLPPATIVTHWDLGGPDVPPALAREGANFPLEIPPAPPEGLLQTRIVRVAGLIPAYTVVYRDDPHYLLLTEYRDLGVRFAAAEIGLPLAAGKHQGRLLLAPLSSTYTFRENGVVYQLFGNVPFEELLAFAARL